MLNRAVVTVKRKKPFFDWLQSIPDPCDVTPEETDNDSAVYLFPEYDDDNERLRILKEFYVLIFEHELSGWWTVESDWPKDRSYKTFTDWFDVQFYSVVHDLVDAPLLDDD